MLITENGRSKWSSIIKEELGVQDQEKLAWMSQLAEIHAIKEGLQPASPDASAGGVFATPLNTMGMGDLRAPSAVGQNGPIGNTGADFHAYNYQRGSGDIPTSTLTMALEIAAHTVGFELVPVVPASGPWGMLQYRDTPYGGGKLGNETLTMQGKGEGTANKPLYIKVVAKQSEMNDVHKDAKKGDKLAFANGGKTLNAEYVGKSRIDNGIIVKVEDCGDEDTSIADVFKGATTTVTGDNVNATLNNAMPDLVASMADHIQGFANFADGGEDPMTRGENESGTGNTIGLRFMSKWIQMGSYEVTGTVTRQQLQDLPLYGIDVIGDVLTAMRDDISQSINRNILDRVFKLGVTNAEIQKNYQGVDLNLHFGTDPQGKELRLFTGWSKFIGIDDAHPTAWGTNGDTKVPTALVQAAAENVYTNQRRIASRCLAAANIIGNVSRFGRGNWIVSNTQIVTALQDCSNFVINPTLNTLRQDNDSMYFAGTLAGLNVYVDPNMTWDDTRVCVGRKSISNGSKYQKPGVVFMPYILCDTVQITAEGTMAPKLLCNSRFAIVDAGMHPEQSYFTFLVDAKDGMLV